MCWSKWVTGDLSHTLSCVVCLEGSGRYFLEVHTTMAMSRNFRHVEYLHSLVVMETVLDEEIDRLESEYDWDRQKMIYLQALECDSSHLVLLEEKLWKCQELIKVYRKLLHDTFDEKLVLYDLMTSQHHKYLEMSTTENKLTKPLTAVNKHSCHYQDDNMSPCQCSADNMSLPQSPTDYLSQSQHKYKHSNNSNKHLKLKYRTTRRLFRHRTVNGKRLTLGRDQQRRRISPPGRMSKYIKTKNFPFRLKQTYSQRNVLKRPGASSKQQKYDGNRSDKLTTSCRGCTHRQHDLYPSDFSSSSNIFSVLGMDFNRLDDSRSDLDAEDQWRQQEMANPLCPRCNSNGASWNDFSFDADRD